MPVGRWLSRNERLSYELVLTLAALFRGGPYNIGYAPVDAEVAAATPGGKHSVQYQLYEECAKIIRARVDPTASGASLQVAEIGSGNGAGAAFLAARHGFRVEGLERSRVGRLVARLRHGVPGRATEAPALPLDDASVDALFTIDSTNYFFGPAFFAEVRRVLRPGGAIVIADYRQRHFRAIRIMFADAFLAAGLERFEARNASDHVLQASDLDAERRRRVLRVVPGRYRERLSYILCLPGSGKYQEYEIGARSYIITSALAPAAETD